ncbi:hypothetical protein ACFFJB_11080 [Camelimonas abortus]|uniref:Uncharacterized protein n=1 Tax=Camelimonas abortus TaxID=1017184 RepID=A0ABV7LCB3_9HYPH
MSLASPFSSRGHSPDRSRARRILSTGLCLAAVAGFAAAADAAPARRAPHGQSQPPATQQAGPRGEVFLNGRWVSDAWCDATVPGPNGGPAGPGRSLCDASTPRR